VHEYGKYFGLAQRVLPVGVVGGAAKNAGETTLLVGIVTADAGEHTGWSHGTSSRARVCAMIFCRVPLDNVTDLHCEPSRANRQGMSPISLLAEELMLSALTSIVVE
jgi:hypothetical protein